ncbi:hypothetical protein HYS99_00660 [Candidatus Giovannonibacteria bacterium]|nr:hypothetical protein [Candidatus Giovannonibacteria bacterium]
MIDDKKPELPKLRTFKSDAEIFTNKKKISEFDIKKTAYLEQKEDRLVRYRPGISIFMKIVIAAAVALVIGGGGYFGYRYLLSKPAVKTPEKAKPPAQIVKADDEKIITFNIVNPGTLISYLISEKEKNLRPGSIVNFPIEAVVETGEIKFIDSKKIAEALSWNAPLSFIENLSGEFNALMIYGEYSHDFSLIMKVNNFDTAISSLISWERTMWPPWKPFFSADDVENVHNFTFVDEIIENNDARIFKNKETGKVILGYSIFNKQYVIFSTSREGLKLILSRLVSLPPR